MNFEKHYCGCSSCKREKKLEDLSLMELRDKVFEITKKQNYISNCNLSEEVTALVIKELQEQKKELLELMHKKVDELQEECKMSEENVEKLIAMLKEEAYVPSDYWGVSDTKVVNLENVLGLIEQLRNYK